MTDPNVFVSFVYYEKNTERHQENLRFFLREGVERFRSSHIDIHLTINGHDCQVELPESGITIHRRDNVGFDFGAHYECLKYALEKVGGNIDALPYNTYIFLNGGQRGPFLPEYWPTDKHWSDVFTDKFDKHGIVGSSQFYHKDGSPVIETWAFALRKDAFKIAWTDGTIFRIHPTKLSAVLAEDHLTPLLVQHGLTYSSLLLKYGKNTNQTNRFDIPSRPWSYEGINLNPLETVFYKTYWDSSANELENLYNDPVEIRYTQWKYGEAEGARTLPETVVKRSAGDETPHHVHPKSNNGKWMIGGAIACAVALVSVVIYFAIYLVIYLAVRRQ